MALTQKQIEAAAKKRGAKPVKHADGLGMYLEVPPTGAPRWRFKYRVRVIDENGAAKLKEKRIGFGTWPTVSLKEARERRDEARVLVSRGIDPSAHRQATREAAADTFKAVAEEWFAKFSPSWAEATRKNKRLRLEKHIYPHVGTLPIADVDERAVLDVLGRLDKHPATQRKTRQIVGEVMRYAMPGRREVRDPTAAIRANHLAPYKPKHHAAVTDPAKLGELVRALEGFEGQPATGWALRLAPLVFVRPGELRRAEWSEIDLDGATWVIPAAKMKTGRDHVVPLSSQALAILQEAHALTGAGRYVFPSLLSSARPMSENTLNAALRRLGFSSDEMTVHGFRATARTLLAEVLGYGFELIDHQLAHEVKDPLGRAYNRTQFLNQRRTMMQRWADYLDGLKAGGKVIPLRPTATH